MLDALSHAHSIVKDLCAAQLDFKQFYEAQYGVIHLIEPSFNLPDTSLYDTVRDFLTEEKMQSLYNVGKKEFQAVLDTFDVETRDYLLEKKYLSEDDDTSGVGAMVYKRVKEVMRKNILSTGTRLDGRKTDEVRKIKSEV